MRFQLLLTNLVLLLLISSCNQQLQNEQKDEASIAQPIRLELNLSGNSRTSRFLGTFDEIDRLTLDLNRVYGNRKVVTGMELNKDNQTSKWIGSIDKLIVGFDYIIKTPRFSVFLRCCTLCFYRSWRLSPEMVTLSIFQKRMKDDFDQVD